MKPIASSLALAIALGFAAVPATAQDADTGAADQGEQQTSYSAQKLAVFVEAARQVRGVVDQYRPQFQSAGSDQERQAVQEEMRGEIVTTIENLDGITVDEYVEIARTARQDEALQERIRGIMEGG